MSNGASLTPPTRVEKAARYGPGASQRISGRSAIGDQLARGGQLRLAPVELAAQLAAAQLVEHLPHPRRLAEAEIGEIGAGDLEADVAQAREVVTESRHVGEREREERRVRRARLGQGGDLRGRCRSAQPLDEPRADRDGGGDLLERRGGEASGTVEPPYDLVGGIRRREHGQAQPPGGDVDGELRIQLAQAGSGARLLVGCEMRVDRAVGAELGQPQDRVLELAFLEQRDELVAEARR